MFIAGLLIIFAIITYTQPKFAVGLILALLPTYLIRLQIQGIPTTFLELMLLVFLFIVFAKNLGNLGRLKKLGNLNWWILAFVAAGIVSTLISPDKHAALGILKAFILEPVLFFYSLQFVIRRFEDLTTPYNLLFLSAVLVSLFGILQYFTFIHLPLRFWGTGVEVERITSVFDYPNALSLYLAPLVALFFSGWLFGGRVLNRKNLLIGLFIMLLGLYLTFSRGAWLAFVLTLIWLLWLRYDYKKVFGSFLVLLALLFAIPATRNRLMLVAHDASSSAHVQLWAAGLQKVKQSPVLGNGLAGYRNTLEQQNFTGEILNYPHNIFLNFWLEMGLVGLVSFFGIIIVSVKKYKKDYNWYLLGALAYLSIFVIHGLVDVPYFKNDLSILFWFVISIFWVNGQKQ